MNYQTKQKTTTASHALASCLYIELFYFSLFLLLLNLHRLHDEIASILNHSLSLYIHVSFCICVSSFFFRSISHSLTRS